MNLTTMTPVDIDTMLADLYYKAMKIRVTIDRHLDGVMCHADARRTYGRGNGGWDMTMADAETKVREALADGTTKSWDVRSHQSTLDALDAAREALGANHAEQTQIGAEFIRRGGWTRAFLVTDGHVHSSRACSTCNNGDQPTSFYWLTEFSGHDEAEVVVAAADRACTVCYPSAPVETAGPSALMTPDERTRAEQRDAAAKAKAERLAKRIANGLTVDGSEFVVTHPGYNDRTATERFKTERAAVQWMVQRIMWGGHGTEDYTPAFEAIVEALMAKYDQTREQVIADIAAKVAAKAKRDNDQPSYDLARLSA